MTMIDTYEDLIVFIAIIIIAFGFMYLGNKTYDGLTSISFKAIGLFILINAVNYKLFEKIEHPNAYKIAIIFLITSAIVSSIIIIRFDVNSKAVIEIIEYIIKLYGVDN